ncbi:MAG: hypothetical protein GY854_19910 [Deltaproteobacteria bacterium]|nr:hypothetical protein [Deltaproteobacteria bacterium]
MNYQLFSFSGPPDSNYNVAHSGTGHFYPILHAPPRADTSAANKLRRIDGVGQAWRITNSNEFGSPAIKWQQNGKSQYTIYEGNVTSGASATYGDTLRTGDRPGKGQIELFHPDFSYEPDSSGEWTWGDIEYNNIMFAAFGLWPGPDINLTDDNAQILDNAMAVGRAIRGYDATDTQPSLGTLIHLIGTTAMTHDSLIGNTKRCLFQCGHPAGVWTDSTSYKTIQPEDALHKVYPRNLLNETTGNYITGYPACVVTVSGAGEGDPACIRYEIHEADGSWLENAIATTESNTTQLLVPDDFDDTLRVDAPGAYVLVKIKAPEGGEITIHTWSLWEDAWSHS